MQQFGLSSVLYFARGPLRWPHRRRHHDADTLAPYFRHGSSGRYRIVGAAALALVAGFYGLVFSLTNTAFLMQLLMPVAVFAIFVIVLLPESGAAFERSLTSVFYVFFAAISVWPDYLALSIGSLPWITAVRLTAVPLCLLFLMSLSQSGGFRGLLAHKLAAAPTVWKPIGVYFLVCIVSVGFSKEPIETLNKLIVALYSWAAIFLVAVAVLSEDRRAKQFAYLLWIGVVAVCSIGIVEWRMGQVPWAGRVPSFLKIEDEAVARIMSGSARFAIGEHRVQSKFTTPLGLAEFLVLVMPFVVHFTISSRNLIERVLAGVTIPLAVFVIVKTDARLGMVGLFLTLFGYLFFWAFNHWKSNRSSIFSPMIVFTYPAILVTAVVASFAVGRIRALVWGTGAHQASNDARQKQVEDGIALIMQHPWGHGIGRAAETLGYTNGAGVVTIDTYFISVGLETGVVGFLAYFGAFLAAIWLGARVALRQGKDTQVVWIVPAVISLINFVVIKSILSQQENHPLAFAMLGMVVALVYRAGRSAGAESGRLV